MKKIGDTIKFRCETNVFTGRIVEVDATDPKLPYRVRVGTRNYWPTFDEMFGETLEVTTQQLMEKLENVEKLLEELLQK